MGGKYDYVINDNMIAGFALVAWPVSYAESGVKTFIVSKDGIVYEIDLGADTETAVKAITSFNPDDSWEGDQQGLRPGALAPGPEAAIRQLPSASPGWR